MFCLIQRISDKPRYPISAFLLLCLFVALQPWGTSAWAGSGASRQGQGPLRESEEVTGGGKGARARQLGVTTLPAEGLTLLDLLFPRISQVRGKREAVQLQGKQEGLLNLFIGSARRGLGPTASFFFGASPDCSSCLLYYDLSLDYGSPSTIGRAESSSPTFQGFLWGQNYCILTLSIISFPIPVVCLYSLLLLLSHQSRLPFCNLTLVQGFFGKMGRWLILSSGSSNLSM